MKKLIVALFASATALFASAKVLTQASFEVDLGGFSRTGGTLMRYDGDAPEECPYPFSSAGVSYCDIDADGETFDSPSSSAAYFDMNVKFTVRDSVNEGDLDGAKLAVYLNSENKIVVSSGDDDSPYVTDLEVDSSGWARLTIAKVTGGFKVYVDGGVVQENDEDKVFEPINNVGETLQVAFDGKGALDNFVARTTDPFIEDIAVTIGGEGYASLADALADDNGAPQLEANASYTIDSRGGSVGVKLNNHTLTVTAPTGLYAYPTTSGDVTTYTADYFPRTATAGQDGTAANPFEVADVDDLQALSAAVAADAATFAGKCYVQTADIDMTSAGAFAGIGTYAKVPTSGKPFTGTYNGQGYTIANVTRAGGDTQGIFNQVGVDGVIENLVVSNMVFDAEVTGEYGFAIVGNAGGGATLRNLTAAGVFGAADKASTHNMAGIVVRVCGGATSDVTTTIDSCTNNATVYGGYTKLGGICAIVQQQTGFTAGGVAFINCANNGNLICMRTKAEAEKSAVTGNAGIIGYTSANNVELTGCSGMGTITNTNGANTDRDAALIGWQYTGYTLKDNGGNSAPANKKMIAYYGNVANVTGFQYATVDNGVATTVTTLAKDTTYLLERNVAASETPVFTLAEAGTFKVDTALGYTFAGTVAVDTSALVPADPVTEGTVTTYGAIAGVASVDDFAYATFAEAVAALEGATDDYVTLLADAETTLYAGATLRVKTDGHTLTVYRSQDVIITDNTDGNHITTFAAVACVATFNGGQYASLSSAIAAWAAADWMAAGMNAVILKADVSEDITIPVNANADVAPMPISLQVTSSATNTISGAVTIVNGAIFAPGAVVLGGDVSVTGTLYRIGNTTVSIGGNLTLADGATLGATYLDAVNPVYAVTGDVEVEGVLNISLSGFALKPGSYEVVTGMSVTRVEGADVAVFVNDDKDDHWVLSGTPTELVITGPAAMVGDEKFASFDDAVTAAGGVKTITLLANASYTLAVGETLIVEAGAFTMTVETPAGYALAETSVSEGVVSYTTQQYVAKLRNPDVGHAAYVPEVYYFSLKAALADVVEQTMSVYADYKAVVTLLADDHVSFAGVQVNDSVPSNGSIVIDKSVIIDGGGHTVYGVSNAEILNATGADVAGLDMTADLVDGSNLLGFFVKGGNVTFRNVTLTEFGDTAYVNKFGYTPIQTASGYTGTLTLNNVNFSKFNRTAVCVRGGTLSMNGGTIAGGTVNKNNGDYFQQPVEVRGGTATISGVTITGGNDIAGNGGGAIVAWSATTVTNVIVNFTGVGIWADYPVITVTGDSTSVTATDKALFVEDGGTINVSAGTFTGALAIDAVPGSSISITGGTFSVDPSDYVASSYAANKSGDVWVVSEYVPPSGIDPESGTEIVVDPTKTPEEQAAEAQQKARSMDVSGAEAAGVAQATWNGYFTKTAEKVNDAWVAKAELNPAVVLPVDSAEETPLTDMLESVAEAAADATGETAASVPTKAGLYYWIEGATDVGAASYTPGTAELGDGTEKPLARPTLTGENGKAFFKVCVGVAAPVKD